MAKKKVYAVKKGKTPGIYETWAECKNQVDGFPGAEYKGFGTLEEAKIYLDASEKKSELIVDNQSNIEKNVLMAYVDGSYNDDTKEFSYGMVILYNGKEEYFSEKVDDTALAEMRNVAGEIKGAEAAMRYSLENNSKSLIIYHDYEGIAKWCIGEWKAKKEGTKAYKEYFDSISDKVAIKFVKVQGHSNDKYNDIADELAKKAIFENNIGEKDTEDENSKMKDNVYISRDIDELNNLLLNEGARLWESFSGEGIKTVGNQKRFEFSVDKKGAKLDIYQRADGTTTFFPTGSNSEYSEVLKAAIEKFGMKNTSENKNHTIFLGQEWCEKVLEYMKQLPNVENSDISDQNKKAYQFVSKIGDKLTLNIYKDHKVNVQGKPLYLYNEFLSLISHVPQITVNDLVEITNTFNETNGKVDDARAKMSALLPNAYNDGKIEETIWKLFSPSVILIEDKKEMDDYSCCVFPALRALEGYLKLLLDVKSITMDKKHTFGKVFIIDDKTGKHKLLPTYKSMIQNCDYEQSLEDIYNYFKETRHKLFHVDQILIATKLIEDKQEAKDTFYEVVNLIENTYNKVKNEL